MSAFDSGDIRPFRPGEPAGAAKSARRLNAVSDALDKLRGYLARSTDPIARGDGWELALCRICDPPGEEEEYTDSRYWVELVMHAPDSVSDDEADLITDENLDENATPTTFTATNIGELLDSGHSLKTGQVVEVWRYRGGLGTPEVYALFYSVGQCDFWAKITGSTALDNGGATYDNRYKYAWTEVERTTTGWQDKSGGRSGTTSTGFALNSIEANNPDDDDTPCIMGNSVDHKGDDYPAGFSLQAVRGTPVVRMHAEPAADDATVTVYTFAYVNSEDGTCNA